jgi:hypothetical protein
MDTKMLRAWVVLGGLAAVRCGDNSNVLAMFEDGGGAGTAATSSTVGSGTTTSTGAGGSTGAAGSTASTTTGAAGSTASTTTGAAGSVGTGGSGGASPFPCVDPKPTTNPPSGYVSCANQMLHRAEKKQCPEIIPRPAMGADGGAATSPPGPPPPCRSDAECVAKPHGHCEYLSGNTSGGGYVCEYGCVKDDECGAGQICLCGSPTGKCVSTSGCTVDSDCGGGLLCVGYYQDCFQTRFACQSPADMCGGDTDCPNMPGCNGHCACKKNGTQAACGGICVASASP